MNRAGYTWADYCYEKTTDKSGTRVYKTARFLTPRWRRNYVYMMFVSPHSRGLIRPQNEISFELLPLKTLPMQIDCR